MSALEIAIIILSSGFGISAIMWAICGLVAILGEKEND